MPEDFDALLAELGILNTRRAKAAAAHLPHYHTHCGVIWSHKASDLNSEAEWEKAHTCPKCGTEQAFKCTPTGEPV